MIRRPVFSATLVVAALAYVPTVLATLDPRHCTAICTNGQVHKSATPCDPGPDVDMNGINDLCDTFCASACGAKLFFCGCKEEAEAPAMSALGAAALGGILLAAGAVIVVRRRRLQAA